MARTRTQDRQDLAHVRALAHQVIVVIAAR
jgi:hypothetical protein